MGRVTALLNIKEIESTCQFSNAGTTQVYRDNAAVKASTALCIRSETSHRLYAVYVLKVHQFARVACPWSYSIQWSRTSGLLGTVRMTW